MKKAFITGITGQDGSYLAELLLEKGYEVHGLIRRSSTFNTSRIEHLYHDVHVKGQPLFLHYGDLVDAGSLVTLLRSIQPDEVYNLGAQSHVAVSFLNPIFTVNADALGVLHCLEAVRVLDKKPRFYQASSSEMYGKVVETPQTEATPFYPRSPYACAKVYGYWQTVNYRESYGIYACNGILFNHESPIRGETFVTRKITRAVAKIALGLQDTIHLGNLSAKRDWGHAKDYVKAMYLMLQQETPEDFVIATGVTTEVRDFVRMAFRELGIVVDFEGEGVNEKGIVRECLNPEYQVETGKVVVRVDHRYFRPTEVELLIGDPTKAKQKLGWIPKHDLASLVKDMVAGDLHLMKRDKYLREGGFDVKNYYE